MAAKPLVESASATALMDAADADNPYRDLQPIRSRDALDWRYKGMSEETWETVTALMNRKRRGDPISFRLHRVALPLGSIAPRVRPQPPPETREFDPEVDQLCRKLWDSFEGYPEL